MPVCQEDGKMKEDEEMNKMRKWLKLNKIKAVPYDKGCGFALMTEKGYDERISKILSGDQFEMKTFRSNSRPVELVEQDRINKILVGLNKEGKISDDILKALKIRGGQIPKIYGLAKVHKEGVPVRPIVSMSGSVYENIGKLISEWLSQIRKPR